MNMTAVFWFALLVVFLVAEASTVTMISLWFAAGALVAMVASLFDAQLWLQLVLFFVVSGGLLFLLRPLVKKHFTPKLLRTNVDALVGSMGRITTPVDNIATSGQVKLGAMEWTARSSDGQPIPAGTLVKVDKIEGVKAFVTPVPEPVNTK